MRNHTSIPCFLSKPWLHLISQRIISIVILQNEACHWVESRVTTVTSQSELLNNCYGSIGFPARPKLISKPTARGVLYITALPTGGLHWLNSVSTLNALPLSYLYSSHVSSFSSVSIPYVIFRCHLIWAWRFNILVFGTEVFIIDFHLYQDYVDFLKQSIEYPFISVTRSHFIRSGKVIAAQRLQISLETYKASSKTNSLCLVKKNINANNWR